MWQIFFIPTHILNLINRNQILSKIEYKAHISYGRQRQEAQNWIHCNQAEPKRESNRAVPLPTKLPSVQPALTVILWSQRNYDRKTDEYVALQYDDLQEASVMKKYIIVLIAMAILLLCLCIYGWIKQESDKKQATTLQKDFFLLWKRSREFCRILWWKCRVLPKICEKSRNGDELYDRR